jgi:hypothetical protein
VLLDGEPMPPDGAPADSAAIRHRLNGGALRLDAEAISGVPVSDRSWIYMLRVPAGGALTLTQLRREVAVAVPARALRFRLWPPILSLADGFPAEPGVPVRLTATERGGRLRLTSMYGGRTRSSELTLSPAYGWVFIAPFELASGSRVRWVTGLGLAGFLLPLGYWAAWTRRPALAAGALAAAVVVALGAISVAARLPPVHWSEWLAAVAGAGAGWALGRRAAYLERRCASPSDSEFS